MRVGENERERERRPRSERGVGWGWGSYGELHQRNTPMHTHIHTHTHTHMYTYRHIYTHQLKASACQYVIYQTVQCIELARSCKIGNCIDC